MIFFLMWSLFQIIHLRIWSYNKFFISILFSKAFMRQVFAEKLYNRFETYIFLRSNESVFLFFYYNRYF